MRKKLMILGAGDAQLHLLEAARELGYETVVCDMRPEMEASKRADRYYPVNYMDRAAILEIARREQIDGVTSNSEPAMLNAAYLCETLGLPGNSMESVETLLSKTKFRALQKKLGLFAPDYALAASEEELLEAMGGMRFPLIVKPNESSGTRGTTKLTEYDEDAARAAFRVCREFSRNGLVSVEEYVEMAGLTANDADVFVLGDDILWDGWYGSVRLADAPMLPSAEVFPPFLSEERKRTIQDAVGRLLRASGVRLGEFNAETYDTPEGDLFVVEINPRQGGNHIPSLIQESTGVDLNRLLVSTAVGDLNYYKSLKGFRRSERHITQYVVFSKRDGAFEQLYVSPEIAPYVQWTELCVKPGDPAPAGRNAADAVAFVDLRFDSAETQRRFTDEIERYIYPVLRG